MPTNAPPAPPPPSDAQPNAAVPPPVKADAPPPPTDHEYDAIKELEGLDSDEPKRDKKPEPKAEDKNGDLKADDKQPQDEPPKEPDKRKASELRLAYERSKETIKAKDVEIERLRADIETAKSKPPEDPEKKVLLEKYEASEKKLKELEKTLQFEAYQKSEEFLAKYRKPYEEAWTKAAAELAELQIELSDGSTRQATVQDLMALAQMPLKEAWAKAKEMFGDAADEMMSHRRKIRELSDAQQKAIDEAQKNGEERRKTEQTQSLQQREKIGKLWQDENKAWSEKFPNWFKPKEGDEEGNALLARGYELADLAFSGAGKKTPEEMVKLHAEVRNKAAAFPRLALNLKRARARIKELETSLAEYEESEPPSGDGGKSRIDKTADDYGDALAELGRMK